MSFGYSVLGFGSSATIASGTSAPTGVSIQNTNGDSRGYISGVDAFDSGGSFVAALRHGVGGASHPVNIMFGAGNTVTVKMESTYSGGDAPTSWAWSGAYTNALGESMITSIANASATSEDYDTFTFTLNGSLTSGWNSQLTFDLTSTNSGGDGVATTVEINLSVS